MPRKPVVKSPVIPATAPEAVGIDAAPTEITEVRLVEYWVARMGGGATEEQNYRKRSAEAAIQALLADGFTLAASAGGGQGEGTLFVFTFTR